MTGNAWIIFPCFLLVAQFAYDTLFFIHRITSDGALQLQRAFSSMYRAARLPLLWHIVQVQEQLHLVKFKFVLMLADNRLLSLSCSTTDIHFSPDGF